MAEKNVCKCIRFARGARRLRKWRRPLTLEPDRVIPAEGSDIDLSGPCFSSVALSRPSEARMTQFARRETS